MKLPDTQRLTTQEVNSEDFRKRQIQTRRESSHHEMTSVLSVVVLSLEVRGIEEINNIYNLHATSVIIYFGRRCYLPSQSNFWFLLQHNSWEGNLNTTSLFKVCKRLCLMMQGKQSTFSPSSLFFWRKPWSEGFMSKYFIARFLQQQPISPPLPLISATTQYMSGI